MPEFLELLQPSDALKRFFEYYRPSPSAEVVDTISAHNRVTFSPISAPHPLPTFVRSTVDGYAVRSKDTFGASGSLPVYLKLAGEVPMGQIPGFDIGLHQCALIHTGGMLPASADAVVMIEYSQDIDGREVEILRAVAPNENVIQVGEDVRSGDEIIPAGMRLRPADIGGLLAIGITEISVAKKPRVGIISSGDELVSPETQVKPGQVRDINSYSLSAFVERNGGEAVRLGIISDNLQELFASAESVLAEIDILIFTAGSSASTRDLTAQVINRLGSPGVLVHGINIRPGKPTILAVCDRKAVIGLPGNPVSALLIADRFVTKILDAIQGVTQIIPRPGVKARLSINLSSQSGREDWIPVRLIRETDGFVAEPIFGKSNLIFTLSQSDGMICIPSSANGMSAGETVMVYFL